MADQKRYEILDDLPTPVFVLKVGVDGVPRYAAYNTECQRQSGQSREEMVGKSVVEIYGEEKGLATLQRHKEVAETGAPLTYEWSGPDQGITHDLRTTLTPVFGATGELEEIIGTVKNITLEENFATAGLRSEALSNELSDYIGMAAHDLRTPMRNIESLIGMIRHDFIDRGDGKLRLIEMLGDVAKKSFEVISDILSATAALQAEPESRSFAVHSLISDILEALGVNNPELVNVPRGWMYGDKRVVQLTLHNLLDNVMKHAGTKTLSASIELHSQPDETVQIIVRDNGDGFSDPAMVFLSGEKLRVESGFGLFGVRRLIQKRGGSIEAQNRKDGKGAKVIVTLPGSYQAADTPIAVNS